MKKLLKAAVPLGMLVGGDALAGTVQVSRNGDRQAVAGAEANFTGQVTVTGSATTAPNRYPSVLYGATTGWVAPVTSVARARNV